MIRYIMPHNKQFAVWATFIIREKLNIPWVILYVVVSKGT